METIKLNISYDQKTLEPVIEFIQKTREGAFTEVSPDISEQVEDMRFDSVQEIPVLYGMIF
ncbi:MAG: hypothetical protein IKH89_06885 [Bacteroidales bacterium]|nr:hypothetical protein [Bacteroidales bacterium]